MHKMALLYSNNRYVGMFRCVCLVQEKDRCTGFKKAFLKGSHFPYSILDQDDDLILITAD